MNVINAHAHIYPAKIAAKATKAVGDFYDLYMHIPAGTAEALISDGEKIGTKKYVVHSCATNAHQVKTINDFIYSETQKHKEFIGFMTLHQDMTEEEMHEEITRCAERGFKGIKLHPDFQKFFIDGKEAEKFYRAAEGRLPFLMHVGDDRYDCSKPFRLAAAAEKFPRTKFICAHMGGYRCWSDAMVFRGKENVRFDTCSSLAFISREEAKKIIDGLGAENFFFATDFPMWDSESELERFMKINLTDGEREKILSENIEDFLSEF